MPALLAEVASKGRYPGHCMFTVGFTTAASVQGCAEYCNASVLYLWRWNTSHMDVFIHGSVVVMAHGLLMVVWLDVPSLEARR